VTSHQHQLRRLIVGVGAIAGFSAALWLIWGRVLPDMLSGSAADRCIKDYYSADQYSVLSIARNVADGKPAYVEPYSGSGDSIYPSGYYYILGQVARITDSSVLWSWNFVGLLMTSGLIVLSFVWARRASGGTVGWLLAPAPFFVGTLYWWQSGGWLYQQESAVVWPPSASLYSPGAESPALLLGGISLLLLWIALDKQVQHPWISYVAAGLLLGSSLHLHANIAVFCLLAGFAAIVADYLLTQASARRVRWVLCGASSTFAVLLLIPPSGAIVRLFCVLGATTLALCSDGVWRRNYGRLFVCWAGAAAAAGGPLLFRIGTQIVSGDGYFYERQASVVSVEVSPPILRTLLLFAPIWLLTLTVGGWLVRRHCVTRIQTPRLAVLLGLCVATFASVSGDVLGAQGLEWHRFGIYAAFFLTMACAPILGAMFRDDSATFPRFTAAGLGVLLLATLPTTFAFARERPGFACTPQDEINAYRDIGSRISSEEVVLLDRCLPPGRFKVLSGSRVAFFNLGIAPPPDIEAGRRAIAEISAGVIPSDTTLAKIGATRFLTHSMCAGVPGADLAERFGPPIVEVPLQNAAAFGFPGGVTYRVYRIPLDHVSPAHQDG
jgi:hypothetical protein